jgi:hypothetical protein
MQHTPSNITVYVTSNYRQFTRIRGNRELNQTKVKKMVRDIKHGVNLLPDFPILVSEEGAKLRVIDGQHRLEAATETKQPVYYIIRQEQLELVKMARLNSLQEKWKPRDFIACYIEQGIKDYEKLQDFIAKYETPISMSVRLLSNGVVSDGTASDDMEAFRRGEFKVKHWKQAVEIVETCRLFEASRYWNTRPFMVAITRLLQADKCDFDELIEKFKENPSAITPHGDYKGYLVNLEQIYNKGYKNRRTIY